MKTTIAKFLYFSFFCFVCGFLICCGAIAAFVLLPLAIVNYAFGNPLDAILGDEWLHIGPMERARYLEQANAIAQEDHL